MGFIGVNVLILLDWGNHLVTWNGNGMLRCGVIFECRGFECKFGISVDNSGV
jgi:hypothetical protein